MSRFAWLVAAVLIGCRPTPEHYPGQLVDSGALGTPFMARQRVIARRGGDVSTFEAVLQYDGETLVLLGLSPMGTKAFALRQQGKEVHYESFVDRGLPFDPRYVLIDVHRVLFAGIPGAPHPDGTRRARRGDERIAEIWQQGRLRQRSFKRPKGPRGTIVVRYRGGMRPGQRPPTVDLQNGWFGYALTIETLTYQRLGNDLR